MKISGALSLEIDHDIDRTGWLQVIIELNSGQPERRVMTMKTLSLSEAKMKLSGLVDSVFSTDEEVVITRNGSPVAVLISPDEFDGWKETVAIKADAALMDEIRKGRVALKKGKAKLYSLEELFQE